MICEATKHCKVCNCYKPLSEFHIVRQRGKADQIYPLCKACKYIRTLRRYHTHDALPENRVTAGTRLRCKTCGHEFRQPRTGPRKSYCSVACWKARDNGRKFTCETCGRVFGHNGHSNRYCSPTCYHEPRRYGASTAVSFCQLCGRFRKEDGRRCKCRKSTDPWITALRKAASRASRRLKQRESARNDPWKRKLGSIVSGLKNRRRDQPTGKTIRRREHPQDWNGCFNRAIKRGRSRIGQREKHLDPWYRKFASTTRNWRRKHASRSNGRRNNSSVVLDAAKAGVQMCFDWATVDA